MNGLSEWMANALTRSQARSIHRLVAQFQCLDDGTVVSEEAGGHEFESSFFFFELEITVF